MNARDTTISVIIPTCERPNLVVGAIESVLCQRVGPLEVIVVDVSPGAETEALVRAFGPPVRYLRQARLGPAAARNRGVARASGEFLAFLDDDDLWSPNALSLQRSKLLGNPEIDIVLGRTQRMVLREITPGQTAFVNYKAPVRLESLGCGLFRRAIFEQVGPLDEKMQHAEDDDWFMRARALGVNLSFLPDVTLFYRFHGANMSFDKQAKRPDILRIVKNRLDRIRKKAAEQ